MFRRVDSWLAYLSIEHSPATIKAYHYEIERFRAVYPSGETTPDEVFLYLARLSGSVRYRAVNGLRSFFVFAGRTDLRDAIPMPKRDTGKPGRTLTPDELLRVLMSCDTSTVQGRRDLALQSLMVDSGLRAAEVCSLAVGVVDLESRLWWTRVKGGQTKFGSFGNETANYLSVWLADRAILKPNHDRVFVHLRRSHHPALTPDGLRSIFHRIGRQAGLSQYSPHDLRRTFATISTLLGAPPRVLQVAGRWENLSMVERYTASIQAKQMERYLPVSGIMRGDLDR